jgi:hypothetical protein
MKTKEIVGAIVFFVFLFGVGVIIFTYWIDPAAGYGVIIPFIADNKGLMDILVAGWSLALFSYVIQ